MQPEVVLRGRDDQYSLSPTPESSAVAVAAAVVVVAVDLVGLEGE